MNTDFLKYFLAIEKYKTISLAAHALNISQPALTKSLKVLEKSLGVILFKREKRLMQLTYAGQVFASNAKLVVRQEEKLLTKMKMVANGEAGSIALGITGERGSNWLPKLLPEFSKYCPLYQVNTIDGNGLELEEQLLDGKIDMIIYTLPVDTKRFDYEIIADDVVFIAAAKNSPFAQQFDLSKNTLFSPYLISAELLQKQPFLLTKEGLGTRRLADAIFTKLKIKPHVWQEYGRHETMVKMAAAGKQLCITPAMTPYRLGLQNKMCYFTVQNPLFNRHVIAGYLKGRKLNPAEKKLIAIARKVSVDQGCALAKNLFHVVDNI